jgi:hypothetical protein
VYVAGDTVGTLPGQQPNSIYNAFVRKYTPDGTEVWTHQFGISGAVVASAIAVDQQGGVYVAGDNSYAQLPNSTFFGFVRKYTADGTEAWTSLTYASAEVAVWGVAVDSSDNVSVVGDTDGSLPGQISQGGNMDAFVAKYNADGTAAWTHQFGTPVWDSATGVATDAAGNIFVAGWTGGTLPGQTSNGGAFLRKYTPDGTEAWTREFSSGSGDFAHGVAVDSAGSAFVVGETSGILPLQASAGGVDAFVRKYTGDGSEVWTHQFGSAGDDTGLGVALDGVGGVYVSGKTNGTLPGQTSAGGYDAFLAKLTDLGPIISTQPTNQFVYVGQTATFTAAATGWDAGTGGDFVTWQQSTDGFATFTNVGSGTVSGNTTTLYVSTLPPYGALDGTQFRAVFSTLTASATTNAAKLWVYGAPTITQQPPTDLWTNGLLEPSWGPVIHASATCNGPFSAAWQRYDPLTGWSTWGTFSTPPWGHGTYDISATIPLGYKYDGEPFRVVVSNPGGSTISNVSTLHYYYWAPTSWGSWGSGGSLGNPVNPTGSVGDPVTVYATINGYATPATVQWQISTDGGQTFSNFTGGQSGSNQGVSSYTFTATAADNGAMLRAVFSDPVGDSVTTNGLTLTVTGAVTVSSVSAHWGTAGTAALQFASDGLRLLPAGRNTDIPWMGLNSLAINLSAPVTLLPSDISVKGVNVADYGPVTLTGSGTSYVITFAQPINAADRVTVTINNPLATFMGRLDVLPGDVNDDGVVNAQDIVLIRNQILGLGNSTIATFGDINGDGVVDMTDFNLVRQRIGTTLP